MRPRSIRALGLFLLASGFGIAAKSQAADAPPTRAPALKVPEGFEIEMVAGPPLVDHPTMGGFDDQGRLYICDGPGQNMPAKQLLAELPNSIRRLEDTDGDGRFDRATTYANKMTFPMGAQWHAGSVYTASPPHIWKLTDADGDGIAEQRKILVSEFGFTGNAADIHGCFLGPDGWLYWCDGRHGHNFVDEHGNQISKGLAVRLFRCCLDGTKVESFAGGGMDNPVEVCFTDAGEPLGTVAIFDVIDGRHDALVHWVYGGAYQRGDPKCIEEFRRTGPLMPQVSRLLGVAPSGIERYRGNALGLEPGEQIFHAQFNTHTVIRSRFERDGGTFRSHDEPFLTSDDPDFHPTDVIEDADGSLLVVDTGGWFRIGCPTSQIAKPEVRGAIYRIRRKGAAGPIDPRGMKLAWAEVAATELVTRLADARPAVRDRALAALVDRGQDAVAALSKVDDAISRGRATWTLAQIGTPEALAVVRDRLGDPDPRVRQIAAQIAGTSRDAAALDALIEILGNDEPPVRREAATALGRVGHAAAVPALLAAMATAGSDRFVEHAIIFGLIEIAACNETAFGLADANPAVRRAAVIALDQMRDSQLTREQVAPLLATDDATLQQAVLEVIERHEGWAPETAPLIAGWLADPQPTTERLAAARAALLAFCREPSIQNVVAKALANRSTSPTMQGLLLEVVARCDLTNVPQAWEEQVARFLTTGEPIIVRQAVATAAARNRQGMYDAALTAIAHASSAPTELRLAALAARAGADRSLAEADLHFLASFLRNDAPPLDRLTAAGVVGRASLSDSQRDELIVYVESAGPLELASLLSAYDAEGSDALGLRLVAALAKAPGLDSLSSGRIEQVLAKYPPAVRDAGRSLIERLNAGLEQQRAHLASLAPSLDGGTIASGKKLFFGSKATCAACHRAGTQGGAIGPDLTKVGQIRSPMDLLESLVYPSASFVRGYESLQVVTDAGQSYAGILSRETADAVFLRTAQREEVRIPRTQIEELVPSKLSIMPQGFDRLLSQQELCDLLAYLRSLK